MPKRIILFVRDNPFPFLALLGLIVGAVVRFAFNAPDAADVVWLAVLVIGGTPVVWHTVRKMLKGNFASDVVAMLAIITAIVMREYFAGVIIVLMQTGGEALENYSLRRASSSLEKLMARAPRVAYRKVADQITKIDVGQVQIGDNLIVRTGDLIPVDGVLLSSQADVDEAALTGEPMTASKQVNDALLSGSINKGDTFEMQATKIASESKYAQIVALVRDAQEDKPPLQRLADRYAVWFTPITLLMCVVGVVITGKLDTILSVLVVATPCPLILAVPVAVIGGINRAAAAGIVIKSGTAIEQIGHARAMVFDKTGTLTFGTPIVDQVVAFDGLVVADLLRLAGSVGQLSSHTLSQAVTLAAQKQGPITLPTNFHEKAGAGIEADVADQHIILGSPRYLEEITGNAVPPQSTTPDLATYIAIDKKPVGLISFKDEIRPGVPQLMQQLHKLGIEHTVMLTGDNKIHAQSVGKAAGIDRVEAGLLPEDKARIVKELALKYQIVAMVGDGINDAPALATATVGIAMGANGTGISAEAADIVLLVDDVTKVAYAIESGQRMLRIAKQSIYIGLGLSFGFMVLASLGLIQPAIGALLQEVVDFTVILNALRAR